MKKLRLLESVEDDHKKILTELGYSNAKKIGAGAEGVAYELDGKVIKIGKRIGEGYTNFVKADNVIKNGNYKLMAKVFDSGEMDGYGYSVKEKLKPIGNTFLLKLEDYCEKNKLDFSGLPENADIVWKLLVIYGRQNCPVTSLTKELFDLFDEVKDINKKLGWEYDFGSGNFGIDKNGKMKAFDL
jgi:hypothetical protein